jgi:hypothetical protein
MTNYKVSSSVHNSVSADFIKECIQKGIYEFCVNSKTRVNNFKQINPGDICWTRIKTGRKGTDKDPIWRLDVISVSSEIEEVKYKDMLMWKHKADFDKIGEDPEIIEKSMYLKGNWTYEGTFGEMTTLSKSIFNKPNYPRTAIKLDESIYFDRSIEI